MHHGEINHYAIPGDYVSVRLVGAGNAEDMKRKKGFVLQEYDKYWTVAVKFQAEIFVINHPTKIKAGYTPVIHCHSC